jgi:hypothetical protein
VRYRYSSRSFAPRFSADPGAPGGGGPAPAPPADFANLLNRSADATALARQLYEDNATARSRIRELEGRVPGEGALVLSAEQAQQWSAYQQLGTDPAALGQQLQQAQQAAADLSRLQRESLVRDVAAVAGFKPAVLADRAGDLEIAVRETTVNGQAVKQAVAVVNGADVPLADYARQHWADYLPALQVTPAAPTGTLLPPQAPAGSPPAGGVLERFLQTMQQQAAAAPNPLAPKAS